MQLWKPYALELDWLEFYYRINNKTADAFTIAQIGTLWRSTAQGSE